MDVPRGDAKSLKKLRDTDCSQFESSDSAVATHTSVSPSRSAKDVIPEGLSEDRLYYWERMSQLIRIQKWWKGVHARRVIHAKAVRRREELAAMFETECAATIQTAWRRFHHEKLNE